LVVLHRCCIGRLGSTRYLKGTPRSMSLRRSSHALLVLSQSDGKSMDTCISTTICSSPGQPPDPFFLIHAPSSACVARQSMLHPSARSSREDRPPRCYLQLQAILREWRRPALLEPPTPFYQHSFQSCPLGHRSTNAFRFHRAVHVSVSPGPACIPQSRTASVAKQG
jgi:hypothetical protein